MIKNKKLLFIASLLLITLLISSCENNDYSTSDRLNKIVESEFKGDGIYSFEAINRVDGSWNPVILVFGYYDNKVVCDLLIEHGNDTAPERGFRCREI